MKKGIGGHQSATAKNYEWLTPPYIVKALGTFDLDPCSPIVRPDGFDTAKRYYTIIDDGLSHHWDGRIWLNPPYGDFMKDWLQKLSIHDNGIGLIFARTDTQAFHRQVFDTAASALFIEGRLTFYDVYGNPAAANGGAPSVLISYGRDNIDALHDACNSKQIPGKHVLLNYTPVIMVGISRSWKTVVTLTLQKLNGTGDLKTIYKIVERLAPEKTRKTNTYKEKVRQTLQLHFTKIKRGEYSL